MNWSAMIHCDACTPIRLAISYWKGYHLWRPHWSINLVSSITIYTDSTHIKSIVLDSHYLIPPSGWTFPSWESPKNNQSGPIMARHNLLPGFRSIDRCCQAVLYVLPLDPNVQTTCLHPIGRSYHFTQIGIASAKAKGRIVRDVLCLFRWDYRGIGPCFLMGAASQVYFPILD